MNVTRCATAALVCASMLLFLGSRDARAGIVDAQASAQSVGHVADQLAALAREARGRRRGTLVVPTLHLEAGGADRAAKTPSVERWLQAALGPIRHERSATAQAQDLSELAASLRRLVSPLSAPSPQERDPEALAAKVLAGRSYQIGGLGPAPAPHETLWERFVAFLGKLVARIFSGIFKAAASAPILGQIFAVALVLLLAGVVGYLVFRLVEALSSVRRARPTKDEGSPIPTRVDPDVLYGLGLEAAAAGRYGQAVALLFQASLASFDREGAVTFDASLTPGEYRRAVRGKVAAVSPQFDILAQTFVLAAFAERPISKSDWSAADAAYSHLRAVLST